MTQGDGVCQGPLPKSPCHGAEGGKLTCATGLPNGPQVALFRTDTAYMSQRTAGRKDAIRQERVLKIYLSFFYGESRLNKLSFVKMPP